jgi:ADP-ribose pyrophosphatase YjhB (NUDIX family)
VTVERRRAVRVLLLDGQDRVLLLHGFDPARPEVTWWITPGGGLEPGETVSRAARRELAEEVGLTAVELGPVIAYGTASFSFEGRNFEQDQCFHLARTRQTEVTLTKGGPEEHARFLEARWWTLAELRATEETVYPVGLAGLVERLLTGGPPVAPVRL